MFDLNDLKQKVQDLAENAGAKLDLETVKQKTREAVQAVSEKTDTAAQTVADQIQDYTGKTVSREQVKKVAVRVGLMAAGLGMAGMIARASTSGMAGTAAGSAADAANGGFDGSFEGQMYGFFADKGGLNIETQTVDEFGCILD